MAVISVRIGEAPGSNLGCEVGSREVLRIFTWSFTYSGNALKQTTSTTAHNPY